jgi:hypothetical protein
MQFSKGEPLLFAQRRFAASEIRFLPAALSRRRRLVWSHFNAFQKERLGWLNDGISPPITTVTSGGVYSITPYESGTGVKALKVLQSTDPSTGLRTWYYIEYRQLIGFDAGLNVYPTSTTGVLIHSGAEGDPQSSLPA